MNHFDLLTLDIWDTVLRRRCHPDEVKLHTSRLFLLNHGTFMQAPGQSVYELTAKRQYYEGEIGREQLCAGFDHEYRIEEVFTRWVSAEVGPCQELVDDIVQDLIRIEFEQELRVSEINPALYRVIDRYKYNRLAFISDFYMPGRMLEQLLITKGWKLPYQEVFSSADYLLNKRSGRLYSAVWEELALQAPEHNVHIGDNPVSDIGIARQLGARAVRFSSIAERKRLRHQARRFNARPAATDAYVSSLNIAAGEVDSMDIKHRQLFRLGQKYALAFLGFGLFILETAAREGHDCVYFFTREGAFFKRIYDALASRGLAGTKAPASNLLEVSRLATFAASVRDVSVEEFMRIWNLYSEQTPCAFLSSLGLSVAEFSRHFNRHGVNSNRRAYLFNDERFLSLLHDEAFSSQLWRSIATKKALLEGYLHEQGFSKRDKTLVVDIGWRGTIQDNLAYCLPNMNITGIYLGIQPFLNTQPENARKLSWGPNANTEPELSGVIYTVTPFEFLCNSPGGSVAGYKDTGEGIIAVRDANEGEEKIFHDYIQYFQDGVMSAADTFADLVLDHGITAQELRQRAIAQMRELVYQPDPLLAELYFSLVHNEIFGLGEFDEKNSDFPYKLFLKSLVSRPFRQQFIQSVLRTGWPQAFFAINRASYLTWYYNHRLDSRSS